MKKLINVALLTLLFLPVISLAHPGRTDSFGCHTCRTNCSSWGLSNGEYHCHNAKALPQPEAPIKSTYGAGGTGYTEPAPEYEKSTPQAPIENTINSNLNTGTRVNSNINPNKVPQVLGTDYNELLTSKEDDDWIAWVIGLGAAGAGGYWLAKR